MAIDTGRRGAEAVLTEEDRRYRKLMLTATGVWAAYAVLVLTVEALLGPAPRPPVSPEASGSATVPATTPLPPPAQARPPSRPAPSLASPGPRRRRWVPPDSIPSGSSSGTTS